MQLVHGSAQDVEGFDLNMGDFFPHTFPTWEQILSMYQVFVFAAVKILEKFRATSMASSTAPTFLYVKLIFFVGSFDTPFILFSMRLQVKTKGRKEFPRLTPRQFPSGTN